MSHVLPNLQTQRIAAGLSLDRLASLANVSIFTLTRLENGGAVSVEASHRIADALGVSLVTLGQTDH